MTRSDDARAEFAAFLRGRRARLQPADVGLPDGSRRRVAGLRREEVAQLAGVGLTWYTWLEQGRPIAASAQVVGAHRARSAAHRRRARPPVRARGPPPA
ncbi:helix-turn-helix domain-containing protein [Microbacterium sp. SLBN-111]|uniref:helix-turn-helix domain-containing protein n=1 Tax=Microbacterium sp. SLBN-111 TaxID=3377733 RepID=UPI003C718017